MSTNEELIMLMAKHNLSLQDVASLIEVRYCKVDLVVPV